MWLPLFILAAHTHTHTHTYIHTHTHTHTHTHALSSPNPQVAEARTRDAVKQIGVEVEHRLAAVAGNRSLWPEVIQAEVTEREAMLETLQVSRLEKLCIKCYGSRMTPPLG